MEEKVAVRKVALEEKKLAAEIDQIRKGLSADQAIEVKDGLGMMVRIWN